VAGGDTAHLPTIDALPAEGLRQADDVVAVNPLGHHLVERRLGVPLPLVQVCLDPDLAAKPR
jgi:hypothetical protein